MLDLEAVAAEVRETFATTHWETRSDEVVLTVELAVAGRSVELGATLTQQLVATVPSIILRQRHSYGHLAHVNASGVVCTGRGETMLPCIERPAAVVVQALRMAEDRLRRSFLQRSTLEMVNEFEAYWREQPDVITVAGHVSPTGPARRIWVQQVSRQNPRPVVVADSMKAFEDYYPTQPYCGEFAQRGLFIRLPAGSMVVPPHPTERWTEREFRERVLSWVLPAEMAKVNKLMGPRMKHRVVIFSIPRPEGGHVLFGAWFGGCSDAHPLSPAGTARRMTPLQVRRLDSDYLRPRGGASTDLGCRRVMIVGCGSVGGYAAEQLLCAGVGAIDLVDPETLEPENCFRHVLGGLNREYADRPRKAHQLKSVLTLKFPYVQLRAFQKDFHTLLAEAPDVVDAADLILFATGSVGAESGAVVSLNRRGVSVPSVHCWVEPHGVGWHALLCQLGQPGCVRCLVSHPASGALHPNRFSFADPTADTDLDLSGCGSRFTPFGNLGAVRCAAQAVELAVDALAGAATEPVLRSERGRARALREAGHSTTTRFDAADAPMQIHGFQVPRCSVCGLM